jgi:hypothetical protein
MIETEAPRPVVSPPTRRAHDRARYPRLARELATLRAMAGIYCRDRHRGRGARRGELCTDCRTLMDYATRRLDRCVFGEDKPTCANCQVHCYGAAMREEVRVMMRYAGPRMMWRHPWLAIAHLVDGRRKAPALPRKSATRSPG